MERARPTRLDATAVRRALDALDGWCDLDGEAIGMTFVFDDFSRAFGFLTRVALLAEKAGHHPDWSNSYNRVEIRLTTYDAGGVTEKDIALARAIDALG